MASSILNQVYKEASATSKGVVQMNNTLNKIYADQVKANKRQEKFLDKLESQRKKEERDEKKRKSDLQSLLTGKEGPKTGPMEEEEEGGGGLLGALGGILTGALGLFKDLMINALGNKFKGILKKFRDLLNKLNPFKKPPKPDPSKDRNKGNRNRTGQRNKNKGGKTGGRTGGKTGGRTGGKTGGKTNVKSGSTPQQVKPQPSGNQQVKARPGNPRLQKPPAAITNKPTPLKAPQAPSPTNISTRPGGPKPTSWIDKLKQGGSNLLKGTKNNLGKITKGGSDILKKLGQNPLVKRIKGVGGALGRLAGPVIIAATMLPKMIELYNKKEYKNLARFVIASAGGIAVGSAASSAVAGLAALAGLPTGGVGAVPVFIGGMVAAAGAGGFTYAMIDGWLEEMGLADEDKSTDKDMEVTPIPEADLKDAASSKSEMQKQYDEMPKDKPGFEIPVQKKQKGGEICGFDSEIIQKRARGGGIFDVPGHGQGDQVPMMLPPGCFVLNRVAASHMFARGGSPCGMVPTLLEPGEKVFMPGNPLMDMAMAFNSTFSRFQTGGVVGETNNNYNNYNNYNNTIDNLSTDTSTSITKLQKGGDVYNDNTTTNIIQQGGDNITNIVKLQKGGPVGKDSKPPPSSKTSKVGSSGVMFKENANIKPGGHMTFIGDGSGFTGEVKLIDGGGQVVTRIGGVSGVARNASASQEERAKVSGTLNPLPDGTYPVESKTTRHPGQTVGEWSAWINNPAGQVGNRGQLYIHNDIGSNGTAGCIGIEAGGSRGSKNSMKFAEMYDKVQPKNVKVSLSSSDGGTYSPGGSNDGGGGASGGGGGGGQTTPQPSEGGSDSISPSSSSPSTPSGGDSSTPSGGAAGALGSIMKPLNDITSQATSGLSKITGTLSNITSQATSGLGKITGALSKAVDNAMGGVKNELNSDKSKSILESIKSQSTSITEQISKGMSGELSGGKTQPKVPTPPVSASPTSTSQYMKTIKEVMDPETRETPTVVQVLPGETKQNEITVQGSPSQNLPPGMTTRCSSWAAADYRYDRSLNTATS